QPGEWDGLLAEVHRGRPIEGLKPDLELVIRNASGLLFQEAHYAAMLSADRQLLLNGFAPPAAALSNQLTSVGPYFTPSSIARALVEEALRVTEFEGQELTIFDPACGSGEFLREALRQLELCGYVGRVRVVGFDISSAACA